MNESHINEEWEEAFDQRKFNFFKDDSKNRAELKDFIRTLYLQALEQGRTEGSRGDYGRKMYMNGYKEALEQAITTAKNETFRLKAPNEVARDYYIMDTAWGKCQETIVKELESLSKLKKV